MKDTLTLGPLTLGAVLFVAALGLRPAWRLLATLPAVVAAVFSGMAVLAATRDGVFAPMVKLQLVESDAAVRSFMLWIYGGFGMLFAWFLAIREKEVAVVHAARTAQLERERTQRAVVESRLMVTQARFEPELLFAVLADVRRRYVESRTEGDALLDDLIAYLRVALPQMREGASTVGREMALAEAYLKIVPAGREGRLSATVQLAPELAKLPFPPMVLLPLVHAASETTASGIVIAASVRPPEAPGTGAFKLAITIDVTTIPPGWGYDRLAALRDTLTNAFGEQASVEIMSGRDTISAEVRWAGIQ